MNRQGARAARNLEPPTETDELARAFLRAAVEVHRALGPGFLESVYEEALCIELSERAIPFQRQQCISIQYKNRPVGQARVDLVIDSALLVELKAVETLVPIHLAQIISYLRATRIRLGLLVNFNVPLLLRNGVKRFILSP
jgi:GxxExxY protein